MTDNLEDVAMEIVREYENELQFPRQDRFKDLEIKITNALRTLRSKTRKEDAEIANQEKVPLETGDELDKAYNLGITHSIKAILKKEEEEHG